MTNTGFPSACIGAIQAAAYAISVPLYDKEGNPNRIAKNAVLDQAYLTARINDTDESRRWYVWGKKINEATAPRAENVVEEAPDGSKYFIREGVRSATFTMFGTSPQHAASIDSARCISTGLYLFDEQFQLIAKYSPETDADYIYPMPVADNTLAAVWNMGENAATAKTVVTFDFDKALEDGQIYTVEHTFAIATVKGLVDVIVEFSNISTTGVTAKLQTIYGKANDLVEVTGVLIGELSLYNVTDSAAVTIATLTEVEDGVYNLTFAAQTIGDVLYLDGVKTGYDFTKVKAQRFVIPS